MPRHTDIYSGAMIAYVTAYICERRERTGFPRYIWHSVLTRAANKLRTDWGW